MSDVLLYIWIVLAGLTSGFLLLGYVGLMIVFIVTFVSDSIRNAILRLIRKKCKI